MTALPKHQSKQGRRSVRTTICLHDEIAEFANEKAQRKFDDNLSRYVRSLIKRDMAKSKAAA